MKRLLLGIVLLLPIAAIWGVFTIGSTKQSAEVGGKIDSLNGVAVYYNGWPSNVSGRNVSGDGYNLGLKYQCVEFVKRYYYEHYKHKMPNSYGHAKDFFDQSLVDGTINRSRNLMQFQNPSKSKPRVGDLVVYAPTVFNEYGHVAIISQVEDDEIEIIQQNPGPTGSSREQYDLDFYDEVWMIDNSRILGWLRMR